METHTRVFLRDKAFAPLAYVAGDTPRRLIIFIHGFLGHPKNTWRGIDEFDGVDDFWREADMLFVTYDSFSESIKGVADRLRRRVVDYFPQPSAEFEDYRTTGAEKRSKIRYRELYLVGHSLGGLIARKAMLDAVSAWAAPGKPWTGDRPSLLDANLRLFSPASAGYRPAGTMTLLDTIESGIGIMRFSAAYRDIQQDSQFLSSTRSSTERLSLNEDGAGLRARTLWANPENVVNTIDYDSDLYSQSADRRTHRTVCKPSRDYTLPWTFISRGQI